MNRGKYLNDVLTNFEAEDIISKLNKIELEEYGTVKMLKKHNELERLNMQSIKNALLGGDDFILETFVNYEKIKDLISELFLSWTFKKHIYPKICKNMIKLNSVKTYIILYHEAIILNLLENFFFHVTACSAADDYIVDMIEYCYEHSSKLIRNGGKEKEVIYTSNTEELKNFNAKLDEESEFKEMENKVKDIEFNLGISSISIIRYISDHLNQLSFPVRHHMMDIKDIPMNLVALIEYKPWVRRVNRTKNPPEKKSEIRDEKDFEEEIFENNKWIKIKSLGNKLPKIEAQIWICLYNIFMCQEANKRYEITEFRKSNLLRLRKYMNDNLFDQIPPLQQMYRALEEISMMQCNSSLSNNPFIVAIVPTLYNILYAPKKEEYYETTSKSILENSFVKGDKKTEMELISEIYNVDNIEYFMDDPKCANCGKDASNRCSRCKQEWYCGKDCQKLRWKEHKGFCAKLANLTKENEENESENKKAEKIIKREENERKEREKINKGNASEVKEVKETIETLEMNKLIEEEKKRIENEEKEKAKEKEPESPKRIFDELD